MLRKRIATSVIGLALPLLGLLLLPDNGTAQSFNFVSIDVPCSACPGGIARRTSIGGISPTGDIVGAYTDAVGGQHGFLLSGGQFTTIDVPKALSTSAAGINPGGDIVGSYTAPVSSAAWGSPAYCPATGSAACIKGFLYSHREFSTILFPGHPGAVPARITPDGSIYGCLHDFDLMGSMYGAAWTRAGDTSLSLAAAHCQTPAWDIRFRCTAVQRLTAMSSSASMSTWPRATSMDTSCATGCFNLTTSRTASSQRFSTLIPRRTLSAITGTPRAKCTGFCSSLMDLCQSQSIIRMPLVPLPRA